jgi:hypothetical protein
MHQYVGFCIPTFSAYGGQETLKVIIVLENLVVAHRKRKMNWKIEKSLQLNCFQIQLNPVNILVFYLF